MKIEISLFGLLHEVLVTAPSPRKDQKGSVNLPQGFSRFSRFVLASQTTRNINFA